MALVEPARGVELLRIRAPERGGAVDALDWDCHDCALAHEDRVDLALVGGLEGGAEGEDVVFCSLDSEVIFFNTFDLGDQRMSDTPRAGSREAAGASAGSRR
jgi:hypothetical protein